MTNLRRDLETVAKEAADLALSYYEKTPFELKSDSSLVTEADRAVERFLAGRLRDLVPEAAFLGEETSGDPAGIERARGSEWVWVVDPIDGTTVFVDGVGTFTICIGLLREGSPFAGAVALPAQRRVAVATRGEGALFAGAPIRVRDEIPEANRATFYVNSKAHLEYHIRFPGKTRSLGSTALHYLHVARGVAMGAISSGHVWDYAAVAAILLEAGGVLRHLDGTEVDWPGGYDGSNLRPALLGAPPSLWDEMARSITRVGER